jgi:ATP-dependent Clp protease adaptor protein ClpS
VSDKPSPSSPTVKTAPKTGEHTATRRIPPYNVIVENDDYHSFQFVIEVLQKALGYSVERAFQLTQLAHNTGRAVVWTGPKEGAELKAEQIQSFHEDRADGTKFGPLGCYIEPAPAA